MTEAGWEVAGVALLVLAWWGLHDVSWLAWVFLLIALYWLLASPAARELWAYIDRLPAHLYQLRGEVS